VRERAAEPEPAERSSDAEATRVMVAPRPFGTARDVADKLAGVTPQQPASSASRTARERTATLASAGAVRIPSPPATSPPEDRVEARFTGLCNIARAAGLAVDHCGREGCDIAAGDRSAPPGVDAGAWARLGTVGLCVCTCDGCARAAALLVQAEQEIHGPPSGRRPR
jgi:hypothetical protein